MSTLQNNIASLEALIDKVNSLPEATGGNVETRTVVISTSKYVYGTEVYYSAMVNDMQVSAIKTSISNEQSVTIENVIANSVMVLKIGVPPIIEGSTLNYFYNGYLSDTSSYIAVFTVNADANINIRE